MNPAENWHPHEVSSQPASVAPPTAVPAVSRKNPRLAALFAIFPGLGHIYNGLYVRGIVFFILFVSLIALTARGAALLGPAIGFVWFFNVLDSYRQATLINYGYAMDLGLTDLPNRPKAGQGGLALGIVFVVLGALGIADYYFAIDWEQVFELWPVALLALGGWLIWGAIRDRRKAALEETSSP
jgi:hypothetical protein